MSVIQVRNLKKSYGQKTVLRGLTFSIEKGESFALLGTNGAGKTTCLECMEGLRSYEEGSVRLEGKPGVQLQSSSLPEHIRAMEALKLFAKWKRSPLDARLTEALGIPEFARKQYHSLSTGQKRRLHLALALIGDPDLLFLDEPTAGLDVEGRAALHQQIRSLKKSGKTVVLATHDLTEVEQLCDRLAILKEGTLAFLGTAGELEQSFGKQYRIRIRTRRGVETFTSPQIEVTLPELLARYRRENLEILDLSVDRGSLEESFIRIAKEDSHEANCFH